MISPLHILLHLKRHRFSLQNEKCLQAEMYEFLLPIFPGIIKEFVIDKKSEIDFLIENIGIEVKIKGGKVAIYKQCERYCMSDKITTLILVTNRSMGFPKEINGKDCYYLNLGEAWL